MASKKKPITQSEIIKALTAAGYELDGFSRKRTGDIHVALTIRLTPTDLIEDGKHLAESICTANGLQAHCKVFPAVPHALLLVTVQMPTPNTQHPTPNTGEAEEPRS